MKTIMTELLGIKYPIMCGGMLWLCRPELCAAISNAGGLGNITAANYDNGEQLREAIQQTKQLTDRPFGVNVTLLPSFRFSEEIYDQFFEVCADEKVAAMEISGAPARKYLDQMHKADTVMIHKVGSVRHARNIERFGYDAVIAAGFEEGGHPLNDDVATTVLTPRICESIGLPVITAGGMADGRSLAAALSLGASGIMMATRFIATTECMVDSRIHQELLERQEQDTTIICKALNLQGRALKNRLVEEILQIEKEGKDPDRIFPMIAGARMKEAWKNGDVDSAAFMVGQSIGMIHEVVSCHDLLEGMVKQAEEITRNNLACFA